ncbi:mitochondrial rRNA methyltransferase 3 [Homo sapiens]|uniref:Mitochondrial rRNA methyltransferase 3 n=1 Tax=Homo sapiens TaxID=9606 RepID=I3L0T6_HUMAN|nr:mitochondrial rRNA methyltransferase 3 [Homo sapiens]
MAALVRPARFVVRPLLQVVQAWDLDARRWVRALRRSPVKVVFPSGEVVEQKRAPGKQPRKAPSEASAQEQREKQPLEESASRAPSTWEESGLRYDKAYPGDRRLRDFCQA